jgi:hypothetical protein
VRPFSQDHVGARIASYFQIEKRRLPPTASENRHESIHRQLYQHDQNAKVQQREDRLHMGESLIGLGTTSLPGDSFVELREVTAMLSTKERRPAFRSVEGWARLILLEVGAIRECEEHGWARVLGDPHAHERAVLVARHDPPPGVSPDGAVAVVEDVLLSIGDTCPECET